jgi:hypothetical protein
MSDEASFSPDELVLPDRWSFDDHGMACDGLHALDVRAGLDPEGEIVVPTDQEAAALPESQRDLLQELYVALRAMHDELHPSDEPEPEPEAEGLFNPVPAGEFVSKAIPRPRWAIENIWPEGAMGVIGGAPKNGKSSLAVELAVTLATGTPFLGLEDHFPMRSAPAPVLYVQVENSEGRVQRDLQDVLVARGLGYFEEWEESLGFDAQVLNPNAPEEEWELSEEVERFETVREFHTTEGYRSNLHVLSNAPLVVNQAEHQAWLRAFVREHGIRYLFLDPLYMLTTLDYEQAPASIRPLLIFFTRLKSEDNCAVVLTHHQTSKHTSGSAASRLLGSTYIFGWYESALFTSRSGALFTLEVDAMREVGVEHEYTLTGRGFGSWLLDEHAQDLTDTLGRRATQVAKKEANITTLGLLQAEHPDWTREQLAAELGVTTKTIGNYREALDERTTMETEPDV